MMENKKMLIFLDSANPLHRVLRRGIVVAFCAFVSLVVNEYTDIAPGYVIPLISGLLVALEKLRREMEEGNGEPDS